MQQALEALELLSQQPTDSALDYADNAITALREALAQPEQEPVAHTTGHCENHKQKGGCQLHNLQCGWPDCDRKPITAPQPEQEPVAWEDVLGAIARGWTHDDNKHKTMDVRLAVAIAKEIQDMVIAPPHRKPLTDEKISDLWCKVSNTDFVTADTHEFARAIEAAHGIKENI